MPDAIFLISEDSKVTRLESQPYESEELLQQLLADFLDLFFRPSRVVVQETTVLKIV